MRLWNRWISDRCCVRRWVPGHSYSSSVDGEVAASNSPLHAGQSAVIVLDPETSAPPAKRTTRRASKASKDESMSEAEFQALKSQCFKEIRQPGRKHASILALIESVTEPDQRGQLIKDVMSDAKRYRKSRLIAALEEMQSAN